MGTDGGKSEKKFDEVVFILSVRKDFANAAISGERRVDSFSRAAWECLSDLTNGHRYGFPRNAWEPNDIHLIDPHPAAYFQLKPRHCGHPLLNKKRFFYVLREKQPIEVLALVTLVR